MDMGYEDLIARVKTPNGKFNGKEIEYALQALNSEGDDSIQKSWVQKFEESFSEKMGVKYSIAVNSGTSGLHAALYAAGIREGDEVIQPAITVVMDAYATIYLGGAPIFADIDPQTWNIDPEKIEELITPKTKAIIVVSLYGLPVDIYPILKIAKKYNLVVIDDSAETLLSKYRGVIAGTLADMAVFSFEKSKHITSGSEGGMVITNDEDLAVKIRKFAGIGYKSLSASVGRTSLASDIYQDPEYERFDIIGFNYRMNSISAAIGLAQFERSDELVGRRVEIGSMFSEALSGCDWMISQFIPEDTTHGYFTYGVRYLGEEAKGITWKEFYEMYKRMGGDGFYACWKPPYLEPSLRGRSFSFQNLNIGLCPVAETYQKQIMAFKTNYRDLSRAREQTNILKNLINKLGR